MHTVYFTFHTRDELLQAVHEWVVLGDDPTPPPLQGWHLAAIKRSDARDAMPLLVAGAIYRDSEARRRTDLDALTATLARKTPLRRGVTRRRAAELLYVLMGPDMYRAFVIDAGRTPAEWVRWTGNALVRDLFPERAR
ncbi:hypothetical protein GCM10009557_18200 [Virgisporangium ochraceum]|uniref:Transcriptional regulator, TetR family n=1 Tax=Virgisporangium ochraceum TaxID=65505 RepID=A0A8J4A3E2_9ACTN|nr:hypothetical protein [Virgisporangium ochraceum]GIJ73493.1 hypothetical protein Voc01_084100 [Virgisporangium ochraceum]